MKHGQRAEAIAAPAWDELSRKGDRAPRPPARRARAAARCYRRAARPVHRSRGVVTRPRHSRTAGALIVHCVYNLCIRIQRTYKRGGTVSHRSHSQSRKYLWNACDSAAPEIIRADQCDVGCASAQAMNRAARGEPSSKARSSRRCHLLRRSPPPRSPHPTRSSDPGQ